MSNVPSSTTLAAGDAPSYPSRGMYEPPRQEEPGGCRETWLLTRAAFAVLLPPVLALAGVLGALAAVLILLTVHPALALLPIAALAVGVYLFARWEQGRFRPPGL